MHDLPNRLKGCFAATFTDLTDEEIPGASVETVADWDSMASVTLLSVVEEEFGVRVPPEDILRFTSYERILTYLRERGGARGATPAERREAS